MSRHPRASTPILHTASALKPGQARRYLAVRSGEDATAALRRARLSGLPWSDAILGRAYLCPPRGDRGALWMFTIDAAKEPRVR